jgi:uncharacterized membrane protein YhaH (DUF805 family)
MRSYFDGLLRYFEFSGRSSRAQYWLYNLVVTLLFSAAIGYEYYATGALPRQDRLSPVLVFLSLFHAIPSISITVRRLHDIGRSGWWYWLLCVPFAGILVVVWMFFASEPGSNDYGDPSGKSSRRTARRADPEPFYARALRPSAASGRGAASGSQRLDGSSERFI